MKRESPPSKRSVGWRSSSERSIYLVKISKELFKKLQKLGYIKFSKHSKNYSKSKKYRYVEDSVLKKYEKYLG